MAGDHCLTDEGANRPALLANLQDPAACLAIHHSHSNCRKLTIKDLVPHLNPSALPTLSSWLVFPSMPMCGHAHTSQEDESLNRQQDWYLLFTPNVIMISYYAPGVEHRAGGERGKEARHGPHSSAMELTVQGNDL